MKDKDPNRWELLGAAIVIVALALLAALAITSGSVVLYMYTSGGV